MSFPCEFAGAGLQYRFLQLVGGQVDQQVQAALDQVQRLAQVMAAVQRNGLTRIGFITELKSP